ncbi:hypothetical protein K443DRAFT_537792 [Laccaria amethystina LaAM-08-1]|uniref:Uncharacterized protein n=1 Tax=Laccaria amethystina LaAM-08-1 TaxID=1095629 RepID=A0A0C9WRT1_9AGAR|nr:hypothetical protein K443DRAFT_537792 [Laccaria amethystina LaAM-08-1]
MISLSYSKSSSSESPASVLTSTSERVSSSSDSWIQFSTPLPYPHSSQSSSMKIGPTRSLGKLSISVVFLSPLDAVTGESVVDFFASLPALALWAAAFLQHEALGGIVSDWNIKKLAFEVESNFSGPLTNHPHRKPLV